VDKIMEAWDSPTSQRIRTWFRNDNVEFLPTFVTTLLVLFALVSFVVVMIPPLHWLAHHYWNFWGMNG
jgi:uncharacterized BrkB/YihY/UPF0761 family membrane protein